MLKMGGNAYKLAYEQAQKEHEATVARCQTRIDALSKKGTLTANDRKEMAKLTQELERSKVKLTNATNQYRAYTDKQNLVDDSQSDNKANSIIPDALSTLSDPTLTTASRLSDLANDANTKITDLFGSNDAKNNQVKLLSGHDTDSGQKETQTKIEQISPDDHAAIKHPPAYVTKPVTEVTTNTKSAPTEQKKEELPKDGPLSKIGEKLKASTGKTATMSDAVNTVTDDLSENIKKSNGVLDNAQAIARSAVDENKKAALKYKENTDGTTETSIDIIDNITSGVTSLTSDDSELDDDIINTDKSLTDNLSSSLSGTLGQLITGGSNNNNNNNNQSVFQTTLSNMTGLGTNNNNLTNIIGAVMLAQGGQNYANITNTSGSSLTNMFGSVTNSSTLNKRYELLSTISPDLVNNLNTLDYANNKTLYDSLLLLFIKDGSAGLLGQLLGSNSSNTLYFDNSSVKVLQNGANTATSAGDANTYKEIIDKIGESNLPNAKQDLVVLNGNNDRDKAIDNAVAFDEICSNLGIEGKDLLVCDTSIAPDATTYDASKVGLFTANNTYMADKYMTEDTRKLVQASIYLNS